jgi:peptidyl-prolyl isomerase G (cyclophilin G)
MSKKFPHVYIDIAIGARPVGRIVFELFSDLTPRTAENFRGLCTGEYGNVGLKATTKKLHYVESKFHRIIDDFMIQGGDITNGDGTGGASIYGPTFDDENFQRRHGCAGLLSMANRGRNTNSSQFFITLKPCPHLDGKHVVFGQVIYGMEVVRRVAKTPVDSTNRPKLPVIITDCGEVGDSKDFLRFDPFKAEELKELKKINKGNVLTFEEKPQEENKEAPEGEAEGEDGENNLGINASNPKLKLLQDEIDEAEEAEMLKKRSIPSDKLSKYAEIKEKIKNARKKNLEAVTQEEYQNTNPAANKQLKVAKAKNYQDTLEAELEFKGIKDKEFLNKPAFSCGPGAKEKSQIFGWDVFNDDTLYRAYDKRCKNMPFYPELYKQQMENPDAVISVSQDKTERMAEDLKNNEKLRKETFSRRRTFNPDEPVTYINERNRVYNKKLERHFKEHAQEIKANIERGTALNN